MKSNSVLIVGCGDLGARTGALLLAQGWQVAGVRRDISRLSAGFSGYTADYTRPGSLEFIAVMKPDYVLATFNPAGRSVQGYHEGFVAAMSNLLGGLGGHRPQHILAVSSTRVFAEQQGGWVDESSPLSEDDPRARAIIAAEQLLLGSGCPASVVRFAGIYGKSGSRLLARIARGELSSPQSGRYGNRIHRDDCAGFLAHLLQLAVAERELDPIYVGVDDEPALQYDVETWLAGRLGVDIQSHAGSLADSSTAGNKRCRNRALHHSGYQLLYPDYQSGYRALLKTL